MGKQVTIAPGFSNVELPVVLTIGGTNGVPVSKVVGVGGFNAGQTAILTNAEYSALPASITRALNAGPTTVPEPFRPSADPAAQAYTQQPLTTGTIPLASGYNVVGPITGPVTLSLAAVPWTAGTRTIVLVQITQDATGSRVVTQPASVKWAGGSAPVMTVTANKTDIFEFASTDGGTTVFGRVMSANS